MFALESNILLFRHNILVAMSSTTSPLQHISHHSHHNNSVVVVVVVHADVSACRGHRHRHSCATYFADVALMLRANANAHSRRYATQTAEMSYSYGLFSYGKGLMVFKTDVVVMACIVMARG